MKKVPIATVKRFFKDNIGREIEAEWPSIKIVGNLGTTELKHPRTKRTIKSMKGNEVAFQTEKGISFLKFGKGDAAFMDENTIELFCGEDNQLAVRYIF